LKDCRAQTKQKRTQKQVTKCTHCYRKRKLLSCSLTFGFYSLADNHKFKIKRPVCKIKLDHVIKNFCLPIVSTTISRYQRTNRLIPIINKTADNRPTPIICASLINSATQVHVRNNQQPVTVCCVSVST